MWTFKQATGQIRSEDLRLQGTGYAGRDAGKNNPAMEGVKGIGPLPCGTYKAVELLEVHPTVGRFALRLEPDEDTTKKILAYGRDPKSFFMHGDSAEHPGLASHGCIVQQRDVRQQFWATYDKTVRVVP